MPRQTTATSTSPDVLPIKPNKTAKTLRSSIAFLLTIACNLFTLRRSLVRGRTPDRFSLCSPWAACTRLLASHDLFRPARRSMPTQYLKSCYLRGLLFVRFVAFSPYPRVGLAWSSVLGGCDDVALEGHVPERPSPHGLRSAPSRAQLF